MKLTWFGHACFLLETNGKKLLFDPFIRPNPLAAHVVVEDIVADYVLLSHGHGDHVADAEEITRRNNALLISNYEIVTWYQEKGLEKTWPLNIGGTHTFDFGKLRYVNAVHSSVLPDGTHGGQPGGFIIDTPEGRLYYAGDTALHADLELIGRFWKPDLAILPIGDNFTMGIEDAILAAGMIGCKRIVGMHFNTFPYIEIDTHQAQNAFAKAGLELILLNIGEQKDV